MARPKVEINKECGIRLKECIKESSYKTQKAFAKAVFMAPETLSSIIHGRQRLTPDRAKQFSNLLNVSTSFLLGEAIFKNIKDEVNYRSELNNAKEYLFHKKYLDIVANLNGLTAHGIDSENRWATKWVLRNNNGESIYILEEKDCDLLCRMIEASIEGISEEFLEGFKEATPKD